MASVQTKRKRESQDMGAMRPAPHMHQGQHDFQHYDLQTGDDDMDANIDFAAMVNSAGDAGDVNVGDVQHDISQLQQQAGDQGNNNANTAAAAMAQYHTMTVPQSTEQTFMTQPTEGGDRQGAPSEQESGNDQHRNSSFADFEAAAAQGEPNGDKSPGEAMDPNNPNSSKPSVGSDAWHKIRKDNHKEVERRRRETINEGINELAKIVPGCEKNKGQILARAVAFITQLKENETQNIEKWTLEKLLTEQAIAELSSSCDKLKADNSRLWRETEQWKRAAQKAGVTPDESDAKDDLDAEEAS